MRCEAVWTLDAVMHGLCIIFRYEDPLGWMERKGQRGGGITPQSCSVAKKGRKEVMLL